MQVTHDKKLLIAFGRSRRATTWQNREIMWSEFLDKLASTTRTRETTAEYAALSKPDRDDVKDVGGFVGGYLKNGKRNNASVVNRCLLCLDVDHADDGLYDDLDMIFINAYALYSTHSHTPEKMRLRLIIPLSRTVTPDEYAAISRRVADDLTLPRFDPTTFEPSRLMYWPSTPDDGECIFRYADEPFLDPDSVLATYTDWRDTSLWPTTRPLEERVRTSTGKQEDPLTKGGIIGAFCRAHSINDVLETILADRYTPTASDDWQGGSARYTFIGGSSTGGLVVYEDKYAYSHHATDPACGHLCNAFDLVRLHLFTPGIGDVADDHASLKAMREYAVQDEQVNALLLEERRQSACQDFNDSDDWTAGLRRDKNGALMNSLSNLRLILENDPDLKAIVFNQLADGLEIKGEVPWKHPARFWRDADDAQLVSHIDSHYGTFSTRNYEIAVTKVTDDRSYHPIREYLNALPLWDGIERLEMLLPVYLDADDNPYVRAVTRKTLCAAVARVFKPGIKFDNILVLNGPQGVGKSTLISRLGGEWYSDSLSVTDMNDKTAAEKLQGYWLLEIGELAGMRKADIDKVKAFISRQDDVYRASFGRRVTPHPRQCVFIGSTNSEMGFLRDITGNRRFWPVKTPGGGAKHTWELTDELVRQIWAEALAYVRAGERLYLDAELEELARSGQRDAMERDEREGLVRAYLERLLPEEWNDMDLFQRRNFLSGSEFGGPTHVGTVQRVRVCRQAQRRFQARRQLLDRDDHGAARRLGKNGKELGISHLWTAANLHAPVAGRWIIAIHNASAIAYAQTCSRGTTRSCSPVVRGVVQDEKP